IGQELGCSEYLARTTVVRGLTRLLAWLGVHGPFEEEEFNLIRLIFGEGMNLNAAAKRLGVTERHAKDITIQVRQKFREGLRPRTSVRLMHQQDRIKEEPMPVESILEKQQIIAELMNLHHRPSLMPGSAGNLLVQLGSAWVSVAHVRRVVFEEEVLKRLHERGNPVDWLATADSTLERTDLPEDALSWAAELQNLSQRSWGVAEALYERVKETAEERKIPFETDNKAEVVERIHRTLVGVSQAIESTLPRDLRRKGNATLCIESSDHQTTLAYWEETQQQRRVNLTQLVIDQALLYGELLPETAEILAEVFAQDIFHGDSTLPDFRHRKESTKTKTWLEWLVPSSSE